jgi:hypothetical protein
MGKKLLIAIVILVVIPILVLGYLGFIPVLSDIIGPRPVDLGVKYTAADLASAQAKSGVVKKELPAGTAVSSSLGYSGKNDVKASFTSEELSAWANSDHWKYFALDDVQIKLNDDGTVESSGRIKTAMLDDYINSVHVNDPDALAVIDKLKLMHNPTYYAKGTMSVKNNVVSLDYDELKVGVFDVPKDLDSRAEDLSTRLLQNNVRSFPGLDVLNVKSLTLDDGKMNFDGTLPAVEYGLKQ